MSADASPNLPAKTAGQLLADVASAQARPFSGTVVESAKLGLPDLPGQDQSSTSPLALLTGSHTVRVWYGGAQQTRLALVGNLSESDLVRNGSDLWLWSSKDRTAQHFKLPAKAAGDRPGEGCPAASDGEGHPAAGGASQALAAIDPTTAVTVDGTARVAGRSAYQLILKPKDTRSLVGSVAIAIDAKTDVPLRVEIFAKGAQVPGVRDRLHHGDLQQAAGVGLPVHRAAAHQGDHQGPVDRVAARSPGRPRAPPTSRRRARGPAPDRAPSRR